MASVPVPALHREVRLAARPEGRLTTGHFEVAEVPVPEAGPGRLLVRNRTMAVFALMRMLMDEHPAELPLPPFAVGAPLWGPAVGEVVAAPDGGFAPGDLVLTYTGWSEYGLADAATAVRLDPGALPDPAAHLSQGAAAYLGVVRGAGVRDGDTVFVTGAAGAVGSMAGQVARLHGAARIIGSTSSRAKADVLVGELGYDAAVVRGAGPVEDQLRAAAPEGIDVLFDNVGGEQLRAAVAVARKGARFALVGALASQLGGDGPVALDTLAVIERGITLRGVSMVDHADLVPIWTEFFGRGLRDGTLTFPATRLSGIGQAPRALCELVEGRHVGTVLVDL